jgi:hypothetical protein
MKDVCIYLFTTQNLKNKGKEKKEKLSSQNIRYTN